jgi:hypothetical protein
LQALGLQTLLQRGLLSKWCLPPQPTQPGPFLRRVPLIFPSLSKNMRYKLTQDPNTVVRSDGFFIERSNESDWSLYEAWLTGNTPDPADVSP